VKEWDKLLPSIAEEIRDAVTSLFGRPEAAEDITLNEVKGKRTRIDATAARILLRRLKDSERSFILISEECGEIHFGSNPKEYLIVDEVDGTTNATHGIPFYATSLAICSGPHLSTAEQGIVMNLTNGDTYQATRGEGARKNGSKLQPSQNHNLKEALLVLDASPTSPSSIEQVIPLVEKCNHVRHYGAAALELCLLAEGRIDAFVDLRERLRITDVAAALLILREAGAVAVGHPRNRLNARLRHNEKVSFAAAGNQVLLEKVEDALRRRG
jgi:myo-inositol-1(or 4)-monophosphatase